MKYTLYIDTKASVASAYSYSIMEAKTLEEAIEEADKAWDETVYLMRIMKKVGKVEHPERGIKAESYEAVLCRRSHGWHRNTDENAETNHTVKAYTSKYGTWFENTTKF